MDMTTPYGPYSATMDQVSELVFLVRHMSRDTKAMISALHDEIAELRQTVESLEDELNANKTQSLRDTVMSQDGSPETWYRYPSVRPTYSAATKSQQPLTPPMDSYMPPPAFTSANVSPSLVADEVVYLPREYAAPVTSAAVCDDFEDLVRPSSFRPTCCRPSQNSNKTSPTHIHSPSCRISRANSGMTIEVHLAQSPPRLIPSPTPWFQPILHDRYNYDESPVELDSIRPLPTSFFHSSINQSRTTASMKPSVDTDDTPQILPSTPSVHSFSFMPASEAHQFDGIFVVEETTQEDNLDGSSDEDFPDSDTTLVNPMNYDVDFEEMPATAQPMIHQKELELASSYTDEHSDTATFDYITKDNAFVKKYTFSRLRTCFQAYASLQTILHHALIILFACLLPTASTSLNALFRILLLAVGIEMYILVALSRLQNHSVDQPAASIEVKETTHGQYKHMNNLLL